MKSDHPLAILQATEPHRCIRCGRRLLQHCANCPERFTFNAQRDVSTAVELSHAQLEPQSNE
jgi:hypothetical protein